MAAVSLAVCAACDGDSGGTADIPAARPDREAPLVAIQFPPDGCLTDAAEVSIAMMVMDASEITQVRVGATAAAVAPDSLWRATVPLALGINDFRVETRDVLGNQNRFAAVLSIRRGNELWIEPSSLTLDLATGDAFVLDPWMRSIFRVRPDGARSRVTGPAAGSGPPLVEPRDVEFLPTRAALLVTDAQLDAVVLVDVASGARTLLSSATVGAGPAPVDLQGCALDLLRNRALVLDVGRAALTAVDLVTGRRSTLSSDALGSGASLGTARRVAFDSERNRALVTLESSGVLLAVDLTSGDRTVFSGGTAGSGPAFVTPFDVTVDFFRGHALVSDLGARAIYQVDLASGARRILSSQSVGNGPDWLVPAGVAFRIDGAPLVIDSSMDALVEVLFGDRRVVSGVTTGAGPAFERPVALASRLFQPERLVVAEPTGLFTMDTSGGARELLSGTERGSGGPLLDLAGVGVSNAPNACIVALDSGLPGLVAIDLFTGNRRTISAGGFTQGPPFSRPRCMVLKPDPGACSNVALVGDRPLDDAAAIFRVDLLRGGRTIVSDLVHGSGPDLVDPVALEFDRFAQSVNVLDAALHSIFSVDLFSGDRRRILELPVLAGTPTDLTFDLQQNRFLVTVVDPPALLAADVRSGTTAVLSDATRGSGPQLGRPVALELVPVAPLASTVGTSVAYVLDAVRGSVVAVDTRTGARVIRAK